VAMRAQQQLAPGARHQRHLLGRVERLAQTRNVRRPPDTRRSCLRPSCTRHMGMSSATAPRPPSQFSAGAASRAHIG
jgi:hypothetical protein